MIIDYAQYPRTIEGYCAKHLCQNNFLCPSPGGLGLTLLEPKKDWVILYNYIDNPCAVPQINEYERMKQSLYARHGWGSSSLDQWASLTVEVVESSFTMIFFTHVYNI